jgi:phage shock protein A
MKILDRLTLLVKADAHGVLEQLEERSLLAKQHLREAELEVARKRARAEALEEEERRLDDEKARLERECTALDEDVELALSGGKEELARFSIRKLLPRRRSARDLQQRIVEIREQRTKLCTRLESQEQELEALQRRVRARLEAERAGEDAIFAREETAADEEVELELLRRRDAVGAQ